MNIVSETAIRERLNILDYHGNVQSKYSRGLLTPLVEVASTCCFSIVAASPSVDLQLPDIISSDKSKPAPLIIRGFHPSSKEETLAFIERNINLNGITGAEKEIQDNLDSFEGRYRWPEVAHLYFL